MRTRTLAFIAIAGAVIVALLLAIAVRGEEPRWITSGKAVPIRQRVRSGDAEVPAARTGPFILTMPPRAAALREWSPRADHAAPDGGIT